MSIVGMTTFSICPGRVAGFRAEFVEARPGRPGAGGADFLVEIGEVNTLICISDLAEHTALPRHAAWAGELHARQRTILRSTTLDLYELDPRGLPSAALHAPQLVAVLMEDLANSAAEDTGSIKALTLMPMTGALGRRLRLMPFATADAALSMAIAHSKAGEHSRNALLIPL